MSKSAPDASSRLLLTDSPAEVRYKLKRAVTDSERELVYDPAERPGVSNLLLMLSSLRGTTPEHEVAALNAAGGGAGRLKEATTEAVVEALQPIQAALRRLDDDPGYVDEVERSGRERARAEARRTMAAVRQLVGFG
jgi:tryptophanyl-tRNA synthetase